MSPNQNTVSEAVQKKGVGTGVTTMMAGWRQAWYWAHVHRARHFQSLHFPWVALRPGCHLRPTVISRSGCQHFCFCTREQPANGLRWGPEKSTLARDSDSNMIAGGRRDENELFLPNLERQKEQGAMSPHWLNLYLKNYLVID